MRTKPCGILPIMLKDNKSHDLLQMRHIVADRMTTLAREWHGGNHMLIFCRIQQYKKANGNTNIIKTVLKRQQTYHFVSWHKLKQVIRERHEQIEKYVNLVHSIDFFALQKPYKFKKEEITTTESPQWEIYLQIIMSTRGRWIENLLKTLPIFFSWYD